MPYYQLDSEKLEPGDVILEAGSGLISAAIKVADAGLGPALGIGDKPAFSHVFLYVGMNLIIEADEDVRSLIASRVITDRPEAFRVLRHPSFSTAIGSPFWKSLTGQAAFLAMHPEVNKPYNWRGVFGTKLPFLRGRNHGFFCSQLVSEAYKRLGVPAFKSSISPEEVTPNHFVSDDCALRLVADCFVTLPNRPWLEDYFAKSRYELIKAEPIPLAQITYQVSQEMVRLFGPRVDKLTARIGKKQTIGSPMDLYLTLTFPDLPEADSVSDDLVTFMELRYPVKEIKEFMTLGKVSIEEAISWQDPEITEVVKRTLRKDIAAVEQIIPMLEQQPAMLAMLPPPLKRRSIHEWISNQTKVSLQVEKDFLAWRKQVLARIA